MSKEQMSGMQMVLDNIRPSFEYNVQYVRWFLEGNGADMGCGNCPLMSEPGREVLFNIDISPQPLAIEQVGERFERGDVTFRANFVDLDFIFSSHMVEDLPTREAMIECLSNWKKGVRKGGHIVILIPDMQGGRYPKVDDPSGNPSHRIDVGREFFEDLAKDLKGMKIVQIDTIPHDKSCTMDVVFRVEE